MKEIIKNIMWRTAIIFSVSYFFTPFWERLNNIYQSILPENWSGISTWDSQTTTWENILTWNTWINISILTGDLLLTWENETWSIEIPENPRDYLSYLLDHWVEWTDYIIANLPKQPIIYSSDKKDNNRLKDAYIARTKSVFTLPETTKKGYVLFVVNGGVSVNRDLFIGIDWATKWAIRKDKSLPVAEYWEYLYRMDNIILAGQNGKSINLYNFAKNNQLWLNAFVWESGKYIEKIIIFFK